jgi:hypothetical protein
VTANWKEWDGKERRKAYNDGDLKTLEAFIDGKFKLLNEQFRGILSVQAEHHRDLYGEDIDRPGIKLKVDRLEQAKKNTDKHLIIVYTSAIGLLFKLAWDFIMKAR